MDDEDLDFDEFPEHMGSESMDELQETMVRPREQVPVWRLIEMSREDRSLKMELADFDQYDDFDFAGDLPA